MKASQKQSLKKQLFEFFEQLADNTYSEGQEFEKDGFIVYVDFDFYCFRLLVNKVDVYFDGEPIEEETAEFTSYLNEVSEATNKRNAYAIDLENNILSDRNYNGQFYQLV